MLDLDPAGVAELEVGRWKGAETAVTVETECIFQDRASGVRGIASVVGDGDFLTRIDITGCVDGFALCIAVPIVVSIWKTAVVDEADGRIDATDDGVVTAGQSVGFDDTAERVFAGEIVVK